MAWRLDEAVIRGEIENRVRGWVTGRIWFVGRTEPVELKLAGNALRDLAGRRLAFVNPAPKALPILEVIVPRQMGLVGDITASRRLEVFDGSAGARAAKERWNCFHLEWFSATNGRVLIEAVNYRLEISPDCAWEMSREEERRQRALNAAALENHRAQLRAAELEETLEDPEAEAWRVGEAAQAYVATKGLKDSKEKTGWARSRPGPPTETVAGADSMAEVGEAIQAAAALIRILDTGTIRPTRPRSAAVMARLERVWGELQKVRLAADFCLREKLAEKAWIDEVQREVRQHAAECERLLLELKARLEGRKP